MFAVLKALLSKSKKEWNELDPWLRIALYVEVGFYCAAAFVIFIWQPDFL